MRNEIHRVTGTVAVALLVACSSATEGSTLPASRDAADESQTSETKDAGRRADTGNSGPKDAAHEGAQPSDAGTSGDAETETDATVPDASDAAAMTTDATATDGSYGACTVEGLTGDCITVTSCAAMPGRTSTAGYCPGPTDIECCTDGPTTADNPPIPSGYMLMQQSQVTPAMTAWAVMILNDPTTYPMFSTTTQVFGTLTVLARVEWHPPDFQNSVVHRGVTLYVPT